VDVIVGRADFMGRTTDLAADSANAFEELLFDVDIDPWPAMFRAEHDVQQYIG
jgi:hypothetical protein